VIAPIVFVVTRYMGFLAKFFPAVYNATVRFYDTVYFPIVETLSTWFFSTTFWVFGKFVWAFEVSK
jgi:hypothetical protein